jgi:hypothetical protein
MTTPTVTELIRNGNPVQDRIEPPGHAQRASAPMAPSPSTSRPNAANRRAVSHLRLAVSPAEPAPSLPVAA